MFAFRAATSGAKVLIRAPVSAIHSYKDSTIPVVTVKLAKTTSPGHADRQVF